MSKTVEFFFDYSSPFTYLAATQIERVAAEAGGKVVWKPFFLGGLFKALGGPLVPIQTLSPRKQGYAMLDLERWAQRWEVPFVFTKHFPLNTIAALRVTIAAPEEQRVALIQRLFAKAWAENEDLKDPTVLGAAIAEAGLDASLLARTQEQSIKDQLRVNTEEAEKRGVFGAPTFFVGDELHWGQDRLDFVAEALRG